MEKRERASDDVRLDVKLTEKGAKRRTTGGLSNVWPTKIYDP